jgi:ferredoxin
MKVYVDKDLCMGSGNCVAEAPEVFSIDDDGLAAVAGDEASLSPGYLKAVIAACPAQAIQL